MTVHKRNRYFKLQTSITLGLIVTGVMVGGTISVLLYNNFKTQLFTDLQHRLSNIANVTALHIDGDLHASILGSEDMQSDVYQNYINYFFEILKSEPELTYIYTMRQETDGTIIFYLDAGADPYPSLEEYQPDNPGVPYQEPSNLLLNAFSQPGGTVVETEIYTDEFGSYLSAYAPIYKSNGSLEGYVGVDIAADRILVLERQLLMRSIFIFTLSLPLAILIGWLLGWGFARPIIELTQAALQIAEGNLEPIKEIHSSSLETHQLTQAFNRMADQLRQLVGNLEDRVAERTQEMEHRTQELEAASRVARDAIGTQDLDTLLNNTVNLMRDKFGYYHVGIFLIDDRSENAVLRAATGEIGQKLLEQKTSLKVGEASIVGNVASTGYPRIALEMDNASVFMSHPLLSNSHSEMALPLLVGQRVIGVLNVHSDQKAAFDDDHLHRMQTFADQIAIAIENSRLTKQAQDAFEELRLISQAQAGNVWAHRALESQTAFEYDGLDINPAKRDLPESVREQLDAGQPVTFKAENSNLPTLLVPLLLRGQLIGTVGIEKENAEYIWPDDEIAIVENAALQAALTLETARLLEDAQRRASREQAIGEITTNISASTDIEAILRNVVSELGRHISGAKVAVALGTENEEIAVGATE